MHGAVPETLKPLWLLFQIVLQRSVWFWSRQSLEISSQNTNISRFFFQRQTCMHVADPETLWLLLQIVLLRSAWFWSNLSLEITNTQTLLEFGRLKATKYIGKALCSIFRYWLQELWELSEKVFNWSFRTLEAFKPLKKCPLKIEMHFASFKWWENIAHWEKCIESKNASLHNTYIQTAEKITKEIFPSKVSKYQTHIFKILAWLSPTALYEINRRGGVGKRVYKQVVAWYGWPLVWTATNSNDHWSIIMAMIRAF